MTLDPRELTEFRRVVTQARCGRGEEWEASRRLVEPMRLPTTLQGLRDAVAASSWPFTLKKAVTAALESTRLNQVREISGESLKHLTGLPPTKAVRALCLVLNFMPPVARSPEPLHSPAEVEAVVRKSDNPFDLLLVSPKPSLLDLGAGDLTFADELSAHSLKSRPGVSLHRRSGHVQSR
jgi:hypothetical protein